MASSAQEIRSIWPYREKADSEPITLRSRGSAAQRGIGLRQRTSFPVLLCEGPHAAHCRSVELSATGIIVERGRELSEREQRALFKLELFLPGQPRPIRVLAKLARRSGLTEYAFKFVLISDVDRLTLMEHLDRQQRESLRLLEDVEHGELEHGHIQHSAA
jgi:hypothetical protein